MKEQRMSVLNHQSTEKFLSSVNDYSSSKTANKSSTLKWLSIIAYLIILVGSLFTF
jgi:hypothetical protein